MRHVLLRSSTFVRDAKRMLRKHPELAEYLLQTLRLMEINPHAPALKTHKLKGKLKSSWSCSGGYDLRVVFSFTKYSDKPAILSKQWGHTTRYTEYLLKPFRWISEDFSQLELAA